MIQWLDYTVHWIRKQTRCSSCASLSLKAGLIHIFNNNLTWPFTCFAVRLYLLTILQHLHKCLFLLYIWKALRCASYIVYLKGNLHLKKIIDAILMQEECEDSSRKSVLMIIKLHSLQQTLLKNSFPRGNIHPITLCYFEHSGIQLVVFILFFLIYFFFLVSLCTSVFVYISLISLWFYVQPLSRASYT